MGLNALNEEGILLDRKLSLLKEFLVHHRKISYHYLPSRNLSFHEYLGPTVLANNDRLASLTGKDLCDLNLFALNGLLQFIGFNQVNSTYQFNLVASFLTDAIELLSRESLTQEQQMFGQYLENCNRRAIATLEVRNQIYRKPFIPCPEQGYSKSFLDRANWRKHIDKKHRTTFTCNLDGCLDTFPSNDELRAHRLDAHNTIYEFGCSVCDEFCDNQGSVNRHRGRYHPEANPFQCPYEDCFNGYSYSSGLRAHIVQVHLNSNERVFPCTERDCTLTFQRKGHLHGHLRGVHGIEPAHDYECDRTDCNQDFITWRALRIHQRLDHSKIPCGCCWSCYMYVEKLEAHAKARRPKEKQAPDSTLFHYSEHCHRFYW